MFNASFRSREVSKLLTIRRNRGAALILALLITAIVAALGIEFSAIYTLSTTRVENRWHGSQAHYYLLGAENLAAVVLKEDFNASEIDTLQEDWAQAVPPFQTDDGWLEAILQDAQSKINLNNLDGKIEAQPGQQLTPPQRFTPPQRRFIRLLQTFEDLPLTEQDAIEITEAVIDWLDADDEETGFGGAESIFYSNEEPAYVPANRPFSSVSELRLVRHVTPELYVRLEPWLVALPQSTNLNINTAPGEILRTLNNQDTLRPMDQNDVDAIIEDRELQPYESISDFFDNPVVGSILSDAVTNNANLGVATDYFILYGKATVGEQERNAVSYLQREQDKVKVVARRFTTY